MSFNEKTAALVETAASAVTMLDGSDQVEIQKLYSIICEIRQQASANDGDLPELEDLKDLTGQSQQQLLHLIKQDIEDTEKAIEAVSNAVIAIQALVSGKPLPVMEPAKEEEVSQPIDQQSQSQAVPQDGFVINEEDGPLIMDFIAESAEHMESAESGLLELESDSTDKEILNQVFRAFHTIKGMAGFLNLVDVNRVAHAAENLLDQSRKGKVTLAGEYTDVIFETMDMIKSMVADLRAAVEQGQTVPVQAGIPELICKLEKCAQGESIEREPAGDKDKKIEAILETETSFEDKRSGQDRRAGSDRRAGMEEKIKVSTSRLDKLINMSGELLIAQLMVAEEVSEVNLGDSLNRKISHQSKIVRELQELTMSMRMVPIQGVFQKMARLVRDLSRKSEKEIEFRTSGEDTELDRTIVDKIADPLIHMVRNSVDHGVENAEDRRKSGKNPTGSVELRAFHEAGNIVIQIEDDGKGLDKDRILQKAIDNGVVEPGQELADEDIFRLIFHAGLSTAQKVTDVSGRGVGMDVVKKNIDALRGKIDISSTPGKGTIFSIRLPLTLAIIDGQIVTVGTERYIIPINSIVNSFRPEPKQVSSVGGRGEQVLVRGQLMPLVRMHKQFGVEPKDEDPSKSLLVVVEEGSNKCCLMVDELQDQQQVVIKNLGKALGRIKGVSGGAIMGDGKISLILDIAGIMEIARS